jgi:hypothetical protein
VGWVILNQLANTSQPSSPEVVQKSVKSNRQESTPSANLVSPAQNQALATDADQKNNPSARSATPSKLAPVQPSDKLSTEALLAATGPQHSPQPDADEVQKFRLSAMEEKALKETTQWTATTATAVLPVGSDLAGKELPSLAVQSDNGSEDLFSHALQADDQEEDTYINIAGARVKKQKLRGVVRQFTRRVGRSFEKSSVLPASYATAME